MSDVWHIWAGDLAQGPTGDLAVVDGIEMGRQRVLRRLLTNPGEYLWNSTYGAGLPAYVGLAPTVAEVAALIKGQMALEEAVAQNPAPVVTVASIPNGLSVDIQYTDAGTSSPVTLSFDLQ